MPASSTTVTSNALRGVSISEARLASSTGSKVQSQNQGAGKVTIAVSLCSVCMVLAMISTPLMPWPLRDTGVGNTSPSPLAVAPTSTDFARKKPRGNVPPSTSSTETNEARLPRPGSGAYFVRVARQSPDRQPHFSAPQRIEVVQYVRDAQGQPVSAGGRLLNRAN